MAFTWPMIKAEKPNRTDDIVGFLASLSAQCGEPDLGVPQGLITYFERRDSEGTLRYLVKQCNSTNLWSRLTARLPSEHNWERDLVLAGLWHLAYHTITNDDVHTPRLPTVIYEAALAVVVTTDHYRSGSVITLLKTIIPDSLLWNLGLLFNVDSGMVSRLLEHPLLPHATAIPSLAHMQASFDKYGDFCLFSFLQGGSLGRLNSGAVLWARVCEAHIQVFAEFLEGCGSGSLPSGATEITRLLRKKRLDAYVVHASHQIRLADSIAHILQKAQRHTELIEELLELFSPQSDLGHQGEGCSLVDVRWFDNATARQTIKESWADYAVRISMTPTVLVPDKLKKTRALWSCLAGKLAPC
ncbi:hypothetical protein DFH09DRAFT_1128062 [Mycena vulgaris]|nr:hypothetical protein DFH09DRAFT_1128062 [Mycena vulgaris]